MKPRSTTKRPSTIESSPTREYSGSATEVHAALLADNRKDEANALVARLVCEIEKLTRDLAQARTRMSKKAEGVSSAQLSLLLSQLAAVKGATASAEGETVPSADESVVGTCDKDSEENPRTTPPAPPVPKEGPARRPLPEGLERMPNPLHVPAAERCCATCGCEMKTIGFERTEIIDYVPGKVFVREDLREKIGCQDCRETVVRAPLGDKVIAGGIFGSTLVAEFVVRKYRDGLSLHRIREEMQRLGIDIPSATISDQILWAATLLEPIHRALLREVVSSHIMQLDGTSLSVMHEEKGQKRSKFLGTLTGAIGDGTSAVYVYASSGHKSGQRDRDIGPEDLLRKRPRGLVLADASNHYDASFRRAELVECGCNMHGRRGFSKALDAGNHRAAIALRAFKQLYDIEEDHRESTAEVRLGARQARSVPIYDVLIAWCHDVEQTASPSSLIAVAARYMIRHEVALRRFLADGQIPIDNGAVERMHRRPAIVRKNMLFAGSHDGARRAAVVFSLFATAELLGLNAALYLADVLPKLARGVSLKHDLPELMPAAWLAAHPDARVPVLNAITTVAEFRIG